MAIRNRKGDSKQPYLTPVLISKASCGLSAMNDSAGNSFIRLPDDVRDLSWHPIVFQKSPEGLLVNSVKHLFIVNEVDMQPQIPLQGLLQNDAQGCDPCTISPFKSMLVGLGDAGLLRLSFSSAGCDLIPFLEWITV
ncbi:hypothetical protein DPMN_008164 [Dreissena polymorpha]|uniref:Uncharacterized protein n=1 Tax=Dreissena polymorpha TaxID=45954 RepID=A0A9D4RWN4_DREPO|nr:hypothetical protein DPMN_008164 [Dreissena polymorpha]